MANEILNLKEIGKEAENAVVSEAPGLATNEGAKRTIQKSSITEAKKVHVLPKKVRFLIKGMMV